jgi:hypothetical protein
VPVPAAWVMPWSVSVEDGTHQGGEDAGTITHREKPKKRKQEETILVLILYFCLALTKVLF